MMMGVDIVRGDGRRVVHRGVGVHHFIAEDLLGLRGELEHH